MKALLLLLLLTGCKTAGTDSIILFGCNCENANTVTQIAPEKKKKKEQQQ